MKRFTSFFVCLGLWLVPAWADLSFWQEKLKQARYSFSNEELRRYFPASKVINGLFDLASRLYGIEIRSVDGIETWHDDTRYFEVYGGDNGPIGGFYADMFARSGKRTGAWIDDCVNRKNLNGRPTLPVGFLVCNFSPPDDSGHSLLTHNEIVTLFHEHEWESAILHAALNSDADYIGALGSQATHNRRLQMLATLPATKRSADCIHGPVGLDIGATNPAEIAISVLSEITAHRRGKIR